MKKENGLQNIVIVMLAVAIVAMSVGFALYSQTLNINGTATFKASKWDVHFNTGTFAETSTIKASNKTVADTVITYEVTLEKPGDTYSFDVDVKNFGTIDAILRKITLAGLTAEEAKYVTYTVNYNGQDYTATADTNVELPHGQSHKVTVTVSYVLPTSAADLPTEDHIKTNLTVALDYVDKDTYQAN